MTVRTRLIATATALALLFLLGVVWLVQRTTSSPGTAPAASPSAAAGPTTAPTSDPTINTPAASGSTATLSTSAATGDPGPPRPRRSIRVTGVRLDGDQVGDRCGLAFLQDPTGVRIRIQKISPTLDPDSPPGQVRLDDEACQEQSQPSCRGASLDPGEFAACVIGVRVSGEPGEYVVRLRLDLAATCTSRVPVPCDQLPAVPSPNDPIDAVWTDAAPDLTVTIEQPSPDPDTPTETPVETPTETPTGAPTETPT